MAPLLRVVREVQILSAPLTVKQNNKLLFLAKKTPNEMTFAEKEGELWSKHFIHRGDTIGTAETGRDN